jgi:hypothetical protein
MRALPFHYRTMSAAPGTAIRIQVRGDCGGDWHLYHGDSWLLTGTPAGTIVATVTIPQDPAWRVFTKGIARDVGSPARSRDRRHDAGFSRPRHARDCGAMFFRFR